MRRLPACFTSCVLHLPACCTSPPARAESSRNRKRAQALRELGALAKEDEKTK